MKIKLKAKDETSNIESTLKVRAVSPYVSNTLVFNIKRNESEIPEPPPQGDPIVYWSNKSGTVNNGTYLDIGELVVDVINANTQIIEEYFVIENVEPECSLSISDFTGTYRFEVISSENNKSVIKLTIDLGTADYKGRNYEFIVKTPGEDLTLKTFVSDHFMNAYVDCWITLTADNDESSTSTRFTAEMTVKIIGITAEPQEKTITQIEYAGMYQSPLLQIGIPPFSFRYMREEYSSGTLPCESFEGQMWGSGMEMNPHFEFINNTQPGHNPKYELIGGFWDAAGIYNINVSE